MVVTSERVLFLGSSIGKVKSNSFPRKSISNVKLDEGLGLSSITLTTSGHNVKVKNLDKVLARQSSVGIQSLIAGVMPSQYANTINAQSIPTPLVTGENTARQSAIPQRADAVKEKKSKSWYKKWWVWVIAALLLIGAIGAIGGAGEKEGDREPIEVTEDVVAGADNDTIGDPIEEGQEEVVAEEEMTTGGLTALYAQTACDLRADKEFPYGVKMHWILGRIAERYLPETDEWFFKVEATVTNQYGAEMKGVNIECYVTGSNDNPQVTQFLAY